MLKVITRRKIKGRRLIIMVIILKLWLVENAINEISPIIISGNKIKNIVLRTPKLTTNVFSCIFESSV